MAIKKTVKITEQDLKQATHGHKFDIETIFRNCRLDHFCMAVAHLMDIGWQAAQQISDKDFEKFEDRGILTREFQINLCEWARMIAWNCTPTELICFCEYQGVFDPQSYYTDASQKTLEKAIKIIDDMDIDYDFDGYDITVGLYKAIAKLIEEQEG